MAQRQHIGAVVVARMDSNRLPGKPLLDLAGKPLIGRVLERVMLAGSALEGVVVATTGRSIDHPIADWCAHQGVMCHRDQGDVNDVAGRVVRASEAAGLTWAARVNADSPLVDGRLIAQGVSCCVEGTDLVTNLRPRAFPYGMAVELIRVRALRQELRVLSAEEREHVTLGPYRRWGEDRVVALPGGNPAWAGARTTVDDPADLARVRAFIEGQLANWPMIAMRDVVEWASRGVAA